MDTVYWVCAVIGGTVMVCQFLLTLIGIGGEDADHGSGAGGHNAGGHDASAGDHEAAGHASTTWLFSVLSLRTIVAGLAFFGLTGLSLTKASSLSNTVILLASLTAGVAAIFIVFWTMRSLSRLNVDGTVSIHQTIGALGTVYLSIPGENAGAGKVHVSVSDRTLEYKATTVHSTIPTGAQIVVVRVAAADTVEVAPAEKMETV